MTLFALSQALIVVAMVFDVMTFQFRERRHVVYSMVAAQVLIAAHFGLLDQWTAVLVIAIAAVRNLVSLKVRSARLMWLFITLAVAVTAFTWSGPLSLLACVGVYSSVVGVVTAIWCASSEKARSRMNRSPPSPMDARRARFLPSQLNIRSSHNGYRSFHYLVCHHRLRDADVYRDGRF